jgi:hypothetical protein
MKQSLPTPALSVATLLSSTHPRYRFGATSLVTLVAVAAVVVATGRHILPEAKMFADMTEQEVGAEADREAEAVAEVLRDPVATVPMVFHTAPPPAALDPGAAQTSEVEAPNADAPALQDDIADVLAQVLQEDAALTEAVPVEDPVEVSAYMARDATEVDPEDGYAGDGREGVDLAGLTVQGLDTPSVVFDWLTNGVAVLELHTPKGIILVTGIGTQQVGSLPDLIFHRISDLEPDPRSDLKVAAFKAGLLSKGLIESQLGMARGIYDIDRIDLTFTHHAVAQILQQQTQFLDSSANGGDKLTPRDIHMTFCFKGRSAQVESIIQSDTQRTLTAPRECEV